MHPKRLISLLTVTALACWSLSAPGAPSSLTLNVIYSFTNGFKPDAGVIRDASGNFHGVTATGGPGKSGGIYEVTSNGVLTNVIWLNGSNGATPLAPLLEDKSGNYYGTASSGGIKNNGTIFEITAAGQFDLLVSFNGTNGTTPMGPLLAASNGWFYGTTYSGGSNSLGTIFRFKDKKTFASLYSLTSSDGSYPASGLIQGTDGNFYGTTEYGGNDGLGSVFQFTPSNTFNTLGSFSSSSGAIPGGLAENGSGNFYGPTIDGGADFVGTIFGMSSSGSVRTLATFGITNGAYPNSPLTLGSDGNWYGTTQEGGAYFQGVIFRLGSRGAAAGLVSFAGTNGSWPQSGIIEGTDGNFYGTTSQGGAHGWGEIYQLAGFAPFIITAPASHKWINNATTQFTVVAGGSAPLSYQWLFDYTNIMAGATNASLVVTNEQLTNSGTYTVIVSNAYGVVSNSSAVLSVAAPTITIVAPPKTVTNASLVISGKASGPVGLASVQYQLNSNGWVAASGTTNWQAAVTLQLGTNSFQAQSIDPVGNPSAIKSVTTFYALSSPLTLQSNGLGSISASFKGTNLIIGSSYKAQAVPGKGWLFSSWTGSISATNNPLTFMMQPNMVLQANFVTNPFIATAGTYEGLFYATNGVAEASAGWLSGLAIKTSGAYSGHVVLQGVSYGFSGGFDIAEQSSTTVARPAPQGGSLAMTLTLSGNQVTGTISGTDNGGWTSAILAEQAAASVGSGQYTMILPPGLGAPSNAPPGYGYALLTNHNGLVTINGATADGAAFGQSAPIVGSGDVPLYASLYGNTGLLIGWLHLDGGLTATNLWWIKSPSPTNALYTNGFTIVVNAMTSAWTPPPANYLAAGELSISNSSLALEYNVSITNTALVKRAGSPTNSLTGTFYPKSGLLKITFGNGAGKATTTGYAAILRDATNGYGFFATNATAGTIILAP